MPDGHLHAVERLVIRLVTLPAGEIGDAGTCHQVAFIGTVDELFGFHNKVWRLFGCVRIFQRNGADAFVLYICLDDAAEADYLQVGVGDEAVHHFGRHTGWEGPLFELVVVFAYTTVKEACQPGDGVFVADVGHAEPARRHTAQVFARFDEEYRLPQFLGRIGGDDAC